MIIRRETLTAAMAATDKDNSRYFLHAVQADPAKKAVIATNGNILLVCTDREPFEDGDFPAMAEAPFHGDPDKPVAIKGEVVQGLLKTMPKRPTIAVLATCQLSTNGGESGQCTVAATDLVNRSVARIDTENAVQFPDYQRVLPKKDRHIITLALGVPVLEVLIKAAKAVISKPTDANGPYVVLTVPVETRKQEDGTEKPTNQVTTPLGLEIKGDSVTVTGVLMPDGRR